MPAIPEGEGSALRQIKASPRELKKKLQEAAGRDRASPANSADLRFVFVAYSHVDEVPAQALVDALMARGIEVRWDKDLVAGENFRCRLDDLLQGAVAVIVIWSHNASDYLIDEAGAGKASGKLVTCRLPGLPPAQVPTGFRGLHCIDATDIDAILRALQRYGLTAKATG